MILKKIGSLSAGCAVAIFSFLMGILQAVSVILQANTPASQLALQIGTEIANTIANKWFLVLILVPIAMALIGFISGVLSAWIYNYIIVKLTGGIKVELAK